jgi:undecaprenyl-diphosphatase
MVESLIHAIGRSAKRFDLRRSGSRGLDRRTALADSPLVSPAKTYLLALILLALWFAMLYLGGPRSAADPALLALFNAPALVPAARALTWLGNAAVLLPLSVTAALVLGWRVSRRAGLVYLTMILAGRAVVEFEKAMVARQRPAPTGQLVHVTTLAFPSGHAAYSMMAWLGLALLATPARHRASAAAAGIALALLVGSTRLVLAVHWPSDVIGGWAFGAGWVLLWTRLAEGTPTPPRH